MRLETLNSANRVRKEFGYKQLAIRSYSTLIRPRLPSVGYKQRAQPLNFDGVAVDMDEVMFDRIVPLNHPYNSNTKIELGLRLAHLAVTKPGDHVVVIGGGNGISATTAAREVGASGKVTIYDGLTGEVHDRFGVTHIENSLRLNGVWDRCEVNHGLVGTKSDTVDRYSQHMDYEAPLIHPSELPACDVLEFDCNGMELMILRELSIRPRALIIEIEAPFYKQMFEGEERPMAVFDELARLGYTVIKQFGHEGRPLSKKQLRELIDIEYRTGEKHELENSAKDSPIVIALRDGVFDASKTRSEEADR